MNLDPSLESYVGLLFEHKYSEITLKAGQPVTGTLRGEHRVLNPTPQDRNSVAQLLGPLLDPDQRQRLVRERSLRVVVPSSRGQIGVTVTAEGTDIQVRLSPANGAAPAEPPPTPAPSSGAREPLPPLSDPTGPAKVASVSPSDHTYAKLKAVQAATAAVTDTPEIDKIFHEMIEKRASDVHISPTRKPYIRVDGEMQVLDHHPEMSSDDIERLFDPIMPQRNKNEYAETNDTDFAYEIRGLARFRCNVFRERHGTGGVFRQIPSDILTAEELKVPKCILDLCYLPKGLVLVTGPTGSGKSTTLAALVDFINARRPLHIITIEDPIEFVHEPKKALVNQREVGVHTTSFKKALRAALREDPDVVLVGEMRDLETISIAIETAETGHLVFGTLHTNTAYTTVDRVIDQFPAGQQNQIRMMLAESLAGVLSQTLARRMTGGRVAAMEILICTAAVSNLIREGKTFQIPSTMQTSKGIGMRTMEDDLARLCRQKIITPIEAYQRSIEKERMKKILADLPGVRAVINEDMVQGMQMGSN
jgi:twitching motility protein PilT